jgi:hypothetical protein
MRKMKSWKNKLYSVVNLKENFEIVVKLGTSHFNARIVQTTMVEITETEQEQIFARTVANQAMTRCGVDCLKKTENIHGLKLKGEFKVCEDCAVAKARQRNVNKDWKGGSQVPGERVNLDISSIKGESFGGSCFWALVVDDHTDYC